MTYTLNCSILLTELPLLERPAAARAAGFTSVEFWWPFERAVPTDRQIDAFIQSLRDAGVRLDALNFFAGDMAAGDRGLVSWKARSSEFEQNAQVVAAIGEATGCRRFNALYGNRRPEYSPAEQDEVALSNLLFATEAVARIGGTVLIEPLSGAEDYPLKTAADAVEVIEKVQSGGRENIALLADFYHLAANGEDVAAVIAAQAKNFGHIQIADFPGRGAPGTGGLPLFTWVERSRQLGYAGKVSLEYQHPADTAFDWLR